VIKHPNQKHGKVILNEKQLPEWITALISADNLMNTTEENKSGITEFFSYMVWDSSYVQIRGFL
jgi:hypothetical protein